MAEVLKRSRRWLAYFGWFLLCGCGSYLIINLNPAVIGWSALIAKAAWEGGLALAIVWLVIKFLPGIPPAIQCWLWRLAYLKLLIVLIWVTPVNLQVLSSLNPTPISAPNPVLVKNQEPITQNNPNSSLKNLSNLGDIIVSNTRAESRQWFYLLLFSVWVFGVSCQGFSLVKAWRQRQQLIHGAVMLKDPVINRCFKELCDRIHLSSIPKLMTARVESGGPFIIGVWRPKIIVPDQVLEHYCLTDLQLMLAHESAHLKRGDLLWNWIPELGQILFFSIHCSGQPG